MATDTVEPAEVVEEVAPEVVETPVETPAPETKVEAFDPEKIDPKVKEHFEKTYSEKYKDYESSKQAAGQFQQLQADPRWKQFVESINVPKKPEPFQITPEEHTAALGDPAKFQELVTRAAQHINQTQYAPKIEQFEKEAQFAKASAELSDTVLKHPEFKELDQAGHILPVLQRYPGISFNDALAIAKQNSGWEAKKAAAEAAGVVQTQKKAMTEKPGNPSSAGKGPRHFKTSSEALEWAASEFRQGRQVEPEDWTSDD